MGLCSLFIVLSCQKDEADVAISEENVDYDQAIIVSRSTIDSDPCGDLLSEPSSAELEYSGLESIFTDDIVYFDLEVALLESEAPQHSFKSDRPISHNKGDKKIKTKKIKVKAYRNVDGRFFFAIIKRHGEKKEMVSLMPSDLISESSQTQTFQSFYKIDLQQDMMMISDLTTSTSNEEDLYSGLPTRYDFQIKNSTYTFTETSYPDYDPVEEITTGEDCDEQKVNSSMAAIGIATGLEDTWAEAMVLCGNDLCSDQCVEAVAAVPYMFANEAALTMPDGTPSITSVTSINLMIFYLEGTGGISSSEADWLEGHPSALVPIYLYLISRDTDLDCGYKSASGIAGSIARAYIDDLVTYSTLGSIDDFACIIEDYFYCVRDDYSRAEFAFNAAMDVYEQYGSTCSMCAGALSARGSVCPCDDVCTSVIASEIESIKDNLIFLCEDQSETLPILESIQSTVCGMSDVNDPLVLFYEELANYVYLDMRVINQVVDIENNINFTDLSNDCINSENEFVCEGCSVGQKTVVQLSQIRARNKLECAIDLLRNYDGNNSAYVSGLLIFHYDNDSETIANFLANVFSYIRLFSVGTGYELEENGTGNCNSSTAAWSFPFGHFTNVRLCCPVFWDQDESGQWSTLIHEWMHLYYVAGDVEYEWGDDFGDLSSLESLFNADSFSELVVDLCP